MEICFIGAGLAGSMAAALLSKLKVTNTDELYKITLYEKREDFRMVKFYVSLVY